MRTDWRRLVPAALATFTTLIGTLATAPVGRAQSITSFDWNEPVVLRLADGRQLAGRYRGVLGSAEDGSDYAYRYDAWRDALGPDAAPALGETLVVARRSGEPMRGVHRGFGDRCLLLGTADSCKLRMVELKEIEDVRPLAGSNAGPGWPEARRWKSAPSPFAIEIRTGDSRVAVPATMVVGRSAAPHPTSNGVVTGLVVGLLIGALAVAAAVAAMADAYSHTML